MALGRVRPSFPVTVVALERQGHGHEAAGPHRLAVADGDRDAVRHRRRARRWSPSTTSPTIPKSAPKTALSGFTPNVEAIAAYRPDLVVIAYDPKGLSGALGRLGITVLHQDGAKSFKGAYQQIRQLGMVTGPRRQRREARHAA